MAEHNSRLSQILKQYESELLDDWIKEQGNTYVSFRDRIKDSELRTQCRDFFRLLTEAVHSGDLNDMRRPEWVHVRQMLESLSRSRASQGFSPSETATFIFSLKGPVFTRIGSEFIRDQDALFETLLRANDMFDRLGLYTVEIFQKGREEVIRRQQEEMLEISTPVVTLWEGILALPMIGTLDSSRTQVVMETLLQRIVETGSKIAIIDITGVPMVDTLVAQHLMKTVAAARLMGADCIISGIRPQIAQTIVHLAVDLGSIITKGTLADAFSLALQRIGQPLARSHSGRVLPQLPT